VQGVVGDHGSGIDRGRKQARVSNGESRGHEITKPAFRAGC